ncbi:dentin sialophosphoprotein-like protein isoform X1 [Tanacetum coccineum]
MTIYCDQEWLPIWWRWYYRTNPVAWSLYGLLTSQYGDVNEPLKLADDSRSVPLRQLLKDQFGYENEFLGVGATDVVGFLFMWWKPQGKFFLKLSRAMKFTPMVWYFIPFRRPIYMVVGIPIHFKKDSTPSMEEISMLRKFLNTVVFPNVAFDLSHSRKSICVLLGVRVWLIYQLQHSGSKKQVSVTNVSERLGDDEVKLGRKGLNPKVEEVIEVNDDRHEDEDVDKNSTDEVVRDHDHDSSEEEESGDQDKLEEGNVLRSSDEGVENEKIQENDGKEDEKSESEDNHNEDDHVKKVVNVNENENKSDGNDQSVREENRNGDDASSEVVDDS